MWFLWKAGVEPIRAAVRSLWITSKTPTKDCKMKFPRELVLCGSLKSEKAGLEKTNASEVSESKKSERTMRLVVFTSEIICIPVCL